MKALKGIMVYVGIVILSLFVIGALLIALMFFTKINLFGYYFVQAHEDRKGIFAEDLTGKEFNNINC